MAACTVSMLGRECWEPLHLPTHLVLPIAVRVDMCGVPLLEACIPRSPENMRFWNMMLLARLSLLIKRPPSDLSKQAFLCRCWMLHTWKLLFGILDLVRSTSPTHKNSEAR